ncbi:MAG TPA: hypothetical protein DDY31_04000 [Lachnospiraceae bacterium]|nr:hypothetical protein [Lachnospiraceae bacterium]
MTEKNQERQIMQMNEQIQKLQKELQTIKEHLAKTENNRDEYKNKYFQFKGIFQRQTHIFYLYQNLSEYCRDALSGIFKGTSFEEFLACGVQPGNIDALWEFSRSHALAGNTEDIVILNQMIEYFVHLYNGTNESPILAFQTVSPGDIFDVDFHIRTQESKASGKISNVILTGLANAYTGEIIKKAVVEIN